MPGERKFPVSGWWTVESVLVMSSGVAPGVKRNLAALFIRNVKTLAKCDNRSSPR